MLRRYERDVIEAIDRAGAVKAYELEDLSGWPTGSCGAALTRLRRFEIVRTNGGHWSLTDLGKIVLALCRGKEARVRMKLAQQRKLTGAGADAP